MLARSIHFLSALALALAAGCSGGGSGAPPAPTPDSLALGAIARDEVVVEMDLDGDGSSDLLTLDTSRDPIVIVEALLGTDGDEPIDATATYLGRALDPAVANVVAAYLSDSLGVAERTDLECLDAAGDPIPLALFE